MQLSGLWSYVDSRGADLLVCSDVDASGANLLAPGSGLMLIQVVQISGLWSYVDRSGAVVQALVLC